jgi:hypothetical protein
VNPEAVLRIAALIAQLVGNRHPADNMRFARAIAAATTSPSEQRLLTVVAWGENWFHPTSYPPFGLTYLIQTNARWCWRNTGTQTQQRWQRANCEHITIEQGARISILQLRWVRQHRCASAASDADVLRRYGWGGECSASPLTTRRMNRAYRLTRHW